MISLPNDCYCSELKVNPSNWKTLKKITKGWFIYYRFYDPIAKQKGQHVKGKLVTVQGMNHFKTVGDRRKATTQLLNDEIHRLKLGYNPILGDVQPDINSSFIDSRTPFINALEMVESGFSAAPSTKSDFQVILRYVKEATAQLRLEAISIGSVTRKHIKLILAQIERNRGKESSHRYNKVRSYLMILFKELVELEAIDANPVREVSKRKKMERLRPVLSLEERTKVNEYLQEHDRPFWRFTHIFFHSGARLTELMKLRLQDVNLNNQTLKVTVIKGRSRKEVLKPIKHIALPFWQEVVKDATEGQYLFAEGLLPGNEPIRTDQIAKRWYRHIKKKLKITADFYSLKHSNLDETAALLSLQDASVMASHTSVALTSKYYAIGEKDRQIERLRNVNNKFA
jgi:site-specific recombinase XerC